MSPAKVLRAHSQAFSITGVNYAPMLSLKTLIEAFTASG